jgi:hypothetical protein
MEQDLPTDVIDSMTAARKEEEEEAAADTFATGQAAPDVIEAAGASVDTRSTTLLGMLAGVDIRETMNHATAIVMTAAMTEEATAIAHTNHVGSGTIVLHDMGRWMVGAHQMARMPAKAVPQ